MGFLAVVLVLMALDYPVGTYTPGIAAAGYPAADYRLVHGS